MPHRRTLARAMVLSVLALPCAAPAGMGGEREAGAQGAALPPGSRRPLSPQEARASFRIAPGLRIELVAAEPDVVDPVSIAFDEDGRMWVVEMGDYPTGPGEGEPPRGRIRVLEDRDGDGRYETSRVFAEHLLFANSAMCWDGGVIVTAAPHVVYLKDTDGDGRADRRDVLFGGFAEENPQLRVNHPTLGLDNWVYVANGLRGGSIRPADDPDAAPVSISGMDFRFHPLDFVGTRGRRPGNRDETSEVRLRRYEAISGMAQFGLTFDDWGARFICDNAHHQRHVVIEDRYLRRNPYLVVPGVVHDTPDHGAQGRVYPLSSNFTTSVLHAGHFTSCCGLVVYRGDLLPEEFHGNSFTCEPAGNLIHRDVLERDGATFVARRACEEVEFVASPDDWFRPVNLTVGPDGALYVADMYRAVIEHPEFMPPELQQRPDLFDGNDRGRIWRIVPEDDAEKRRRRAAARSEGCRGARPQLSRATAEELVALLAHPNAWWRTTAQRLLLERQDGTVVESLRATAAAHESALARLHAVWTLDGLGALDESLVARMLDDPHPRVREQGLLLAERWLRESPGLGERAIACAGDADARVRFQAALALGEIGDRRIVAPLARIAARDAADPWTRIAVMSSLCAHENGPTAGDLLAALFEPAGEFAREASAARLALVQELSTLVGARQDASEAGQVLALMAQWETPAGAGEIPAAGPQWQAAVVNGLAEGVGRRGARLADLLDRLPEEHREAARVVAALFERAARLAPDPDHPVAERLSLVRLLSQASFDVAAAALAGLVHADDQPQELRLAAVQALAQHREADVPAILLEEWRSYTPPVRREVAEVLVRTPARAAALLDALEEQRVLPGELEPQHVQALLSGRMPEEVRRRAEELLAAAVPADRREVLDRYRAALAVEGDVARGREVFREHCAACHRVAAIGVDVGPDISDSRTRTPESLLVDIVNPNAAIDSNYVQYTVALVDGRVLTGVVASETASSIVLRRAENQSDEVLRRDIEEIVSNGMSLMPEGLEQEITIEQMADLIAFLKNWRYQ